ncbi:pantoate--beta-alanine ligase [Fictibacillus aquaticus]|uniref:Pantothenate synthetase n=1 Tax=Fictibacillus aquaticus TaxID=2021314 RepID=A0A235FBC7_9BACL|nr:pantoate--beta-alanine ligase [Fictibacillus aquaticus]OYD58552.1 pantoate--beta-alanine ligase [Fictibacillus aquaticus]
MITIYEQHELKKWVLQQKGDKRSIGFVPTMGYLHEGHLSLIKKAKEENDAVIVSIFVNPLQFGPNEDFDRYPRDIERDSRLAQEAGADLLFHPSVEVMYPFEPAVTVKVNRRADVLCGSSRIGHFDGVATVVAKLFHLTEPSRAYFGLKDAQQVAVIEAMTGDLNFPVEIVPCDTVREQDGLAKSSRNVFLTDEEREEAKVIYASLTEVKDLLLSGVNPLSAKEKLEELLKKKLTGTVDYAEILSYPELKEPSSDSTRLIAAAAVKYSKARLIDNVLIELTPDGKKEVENHV